MDRERERAQAAFCELARITGRTTDEAALQHMIERLYYQGLSTCQPPEDKPDDGAEDSLRAENPCAEWADYERRMRTAMSEQFQSCMICRHLKFSPGAGDFSEITPGYDTEASCLKEHWSTFGFQDWPAIGRQYGKDCKDFALPEDKPDDRGKVQITKDGFVTYASPGYALDRALEQGWRRTA